MTDIAYALGGAPAIPAIPVSSRENFEGSVPADLANDLLWGVPAIAAFLGRPRRGVYWHLERGEIPSQKVGRVWTASKSALREHFGMRGAA